MLPVHRAPSSSVAWTNGVRTNPPHVAFTQAGVRPRHHLSTISGIKRGTYPLPRSCFLTRRTPTFNVGEPLRHRPPSSPRARAQGLAMLVCCGLVKLSMKTFPGSGHHGLIASRATEAAARALYVPAPHTGHEGTAPGGPGPVAMGRWPGRTGFSWTKPAGCHTLCVWAECVDFVPLVDLK
jgi:hypothetical protein